MNLILVPVLLFPTHLVFHPSLLPLLIHHCAHDEHSGESKEEEMMGEKIGE